MGENKFIILLCINMCSDSVHINEFIHADRAATHLLLVTPFFNASFDGIWKVHSLFIVRL